MEGLAVEGWDWRLGAGMAFQRFFLLRFIRDSPLTTFFVTHTHDLIRFDSTALGYLGLTWGVGCQGHFAGVSFTFFFMCLCMRGRFCVVMVMGGAGYLRLVSSAHSLYEYERLRVQRLLCEWNLICGELCCSCLAVDLAFRSEMALTFCFLSLSSDLASTRYDLRILVQGLWVERMLWHVRDVYTVSPR